MVVDREFEFVLSEIREERVNFRAVYDLVLPVHKEKWEHTTKVNILSALALLRHGTTRFTKVLIFWQFKTIVRGMTFRYTEGAANTHRNAIV